MSAPTLSVPAPAPAPAVVSPDVPTMPIYRLSVAQYHAMAKHGILTTNDRVELIHGWLVPKMTKQPPHAISTGLVYDALALIQPGKWHVRSQEPITLVQSEPEPDDALVRGVRRDYVGGHPQASNVALVVEVADTSLQYDRQVKKPLYAEAAIPIYWIVNLEDGQIEVYSDPTGPALQPDYRKEQVFGPTEEVPVIIAGQEVARIPVRDLLP